VPKRRCRRKRRFCRSMRSAICHVAKGIQALRRARERTASVRVEEELTDEIAALREVCRHLTRLKHRRCARPLCRHC